jgi:hypothetical protein
MIMRAPAPSDRIRADGGADDRRSRMNSADADRRCLGTCSSRGDERFRQRYERPSIICGGLGLGGGFI